MSLYIKSQVLRRIRESMQAGKQEYQACTEAGVSQKTLWVWAKRWPRIEHYRQALHLRCGSKRVELVIDANLKSALGGNVAAQCFFLKNKAGWKDVDAPTINIYTQVWNGAIAKAQKVSEQGRILP